MPETRLGVVRGSWMVALAALTLGVGLGRAGRLTYHEAFVAQAAREMIAWGDLLVPTLGGRPWLEKPPLAIWLVALSGRLAGGVGEAVARAPSAVAATLLVAGVGHPGGAAVRGDRRPARRAGPGDDRLDRAARPAGRGRHAAGLPRHLDAGGVRPRAGRGRGAAWRGWRWAFWSGWG